MSFDRRELAGAVADLGVLVPIAAAFLLMGATFLVLGRLGVLDLAARAFPRPIIRGVQLTVGLLFLEVAWGLAAHPPKAFAERALDPSVAVPLALAAVALSLALRRRLIPLALVGAGAAIMLVQSAGDLSLGPSAIALPSLSAATSWTALTVLVVPQLPLTFANSCLACLATSDAARAYFGQKARRVRPGRLATTRGGANLVAGAISGMPVCHGAGGLTAHVAFGARRGERRSPWPGRSSPWRWPPAPILPPC